MDNAGVRGARAFHLALLACVPGGAFALVDLDLRDDVVRTKRGAQFFIRLYAVSDSEERQSIGAMDFVLRWDPLRVRLDGYSNSGNGYNWFSSGWLYSDGPNRDRGDGDAIWTAIARPGSPAYATSQGLLVTTFRFTAVGFFRSSLIWADPGQDPYRTVVYDGFEPNREVTGRLDSGVVVSTLRVGSAGSGGTPEPASGIALGGAVAAWALRRRRGTG